MVVGRQWAFAGKKPGFEINFKIQSHSDRRHIDRLHAEDKGGPAKKPDFEINFKIQSHFGNRHGWSPNLDSY